MRPALLALRGLLVMLAITLVLAAPTLAVGPRLDRGEAAVVRALNRARARYALPRLRVDPRLDSAADLHSHQMLSGGYFEHGAFASRLRRFVHTHAVAETLAMMSAGSCSRRRVSGVVGLWLNSAPHRAIVLSREYRRVGIGRRRGHLNGTPACLVTADFASAR
jgi:uncharacterized protein YkwD